MSQQFITRPFVTVIVTFLAVAILMIFFSTKLNEQKGDVIESKWIVLIEMFFDFFANIVKETLGEKYISKFTPLATMMFCTVFIGNSLVLFGFQEAATDIMFPFTWTFIMFIFWNTYGIYKSGIKHYIADFFTPMWWMFPLEIISFFTKPLTLMVRMFGNVLSGFMMMGMLLALPELLSGIHQALGILGVIVMIPIGGGLSFYFSVFAPFIQALVFTYLVLVNISLLLKD